jgi:hypothetical protein
MTRKPCSLLKRRVAYGTAEVSSASIPDSFQPLSWGVGTTGGSPCMLQNHWLIARFQCSLRTRNNTLASIAYEVQLVQFLVLACTSGALLLLSVGWPFGHASSLCPELLRHLEP